MKKNLLAAIIPVLFFASNGYAQQPWIIGGSSATQGQFPWVGDMRANMGGQFRHFCGASLIHPKWVLTAGHCSLDIPQYGFVALQSKIRFNSVNTGDPLNANGGVECTVKKIFTHPGFDMNNMNQGNDLALFQLTEPVTSITPIALPALADTAQYYTGNDIKIAGWGIKDTFSDPQSPGAIPNTMKWCDSKIFDFAQANAAVGGSLSTNIFAAGYTGTEPQSGAAQGDSGGPLWKEEGGNKKILGLVSFGTQATTLLDKPGYFTKVALYRQWIDSVMNANQNDNPSSIAPTIWNDNEIKIGTAANSINLYFDDLHSAKVDVLLYSMEGKVIYKTEVHNPSFKTYVLSTTGMAKGMYVLRVCNMADGKSYTKKLVNPN